MTFQFDGLSLLPGSFKLQKEKGNPTLLLKEIRLHSPNRGQKAKQFLSEFIDLGFVEILQPDDRKPLNLII